MKSHDTYFKEVDFIEVADQIKNTNKAYDQLFSNLCKEIYVTIRDLSDPSEIMSICYNQAEIALDLFNKHFPQNKQTVCKKGCFYCCNFPVTCPPQVISYLVKYLRESFSENDLNSMLEAMQEYLNQRTNSSTRIRCPFLNDDNICQIYESRPLSCRSFTSFNVQTCRSSLVDNRNITQEPTHYRVYQAVTTALMAAAKNNGLSEHQLDFIPALLEELRSDTNDSTC